MNKCNLLFFLFLYIISSSSISQQNAAFHSIQVKDGLPNQAIWQINQDKSGAIWFGTTQGVAKFDGSKFTVYKSKAGEPNSLSDNLIRSLLVTNRGKLWVGTHFGGVNQFHTWSNSFRPFQFNPSKFNKPLSNEILSLVEGNNENIWVGTANGLIEMNTISRKIERLIYSENNSESIPHNKINTLMNARSGKLWIGTPLGVAIMDEKSDQISRFELPLAKQPNIRSIHESDNGQFWIGTGSGLYSYNQKSKKVSRITGIKDPVILSITSDLYGNIWVGTQLNGIYIIREENVTSGHASINYKYDKGSNHSLRDNTIMSLFRDESGVIWIGTYTSGVSWIAPRTLNFGLYDDSKNSLSCLASPIIYSIYPEPDDSLWLGTRKGLHRIDKNNNCEIFQHDKNNQLSLSNDEIHKILRDSQGVLWIATAKGLNKFNPHNKTFSRLHNQFSETRIYDVLETEHRFLVGTVKGLYIKSQTSDDFELARAREEELKTVKINKIEKDRKDTIFLATKLGLLWVKPDGTLGYYTQRDKKAITEPIRSMHIDKNDVIWAGVDNLGMYRIDPKEKTSRLISNKEGLPEIASWSNILSDDNGYLWINSIKGLFKYNPVKKTLRSYRVSDGLQGEHFARRAAFKDKTGKFYLGGSKGVNIFHPNDIKDNSTPPKLALTRFYHFNKAIKSESSDSSFILNSPISQLKELNLTHRDYDFGFEFTAFSFSDYSQNKYAYKMEGFDKNWNYTNSSYRRANYTNLPAGDYIFKVKASNNHGVWNETPLELKVHISPPPWATPWAYAIYIISFVLALFLFIRYRTKSLQARAKHLEKSITARTQELADEKQKVEQLLSRKNEEFANVSHEFRTPLTLILGPLAQMLRDKQPKKNINRLNIIQRNGYRLLRMVDQLLNLETFRVKSISNKSPQAIGKTIQLIAETFADLAVEKEIKLSIKQIDLINFEFTPDAIEKIILNLLSNATKYTQPGGKIEISAKCTDNQQYEINVKDTGIGIHEEKIDRIFDRFNRVLDENSEQVTGAGIGLALVKSLVEAHQGKIKVTSELGKGTCFTIRLPIINQVEQIDSHANAEIIAMELMSITNQTTEQFENKLATNSTKNNDKPIILVIEDNQDMRSYIVESISENYQTLMAKDGEEGLAIAIKEVPDLIISDIMMPKKDGYETTQALRQNEVTNHIPIVLLTARGDRESRLKGWQEKADEYLTKPFDPEELKLRLSNLLEIRDILKKRFGETVFEQSQSFEKSTAETETTDEITIAEKNQNRIRQKFIKQLNEQIEKIYFEPVVSIKELAKNVAMSERQFYRKMGSVLDMTPAEYIRRFRLEKSKVLLSEGKGLNYTALDVGFTSQSYFGKCFKAQYGISPTQFINGEKESSA